MEDKESLITFTNSITYKPDTTAVVVANAGTILPAFNFTVIQSISSSP